MAVPVVRIQKQKFIHLHPDDLVKLVTWINGESKKPSFISIKHSYNLDGVNIILLNHELSPEEHSQLQEYFHSKKLTTAKVVESYSLDDLVNFFTYMPEFTCDMSNLSLDSIQQFVMKDARKIYKKYYRMSALDKAEYRNFEFDSSEEFELPNELFIFPPKEEGSAYGAVSIDCEMLETQNGREVGRMTVLNLDGELIFDVYVRPDGTVTDYLTEFSGLDKESFLDSISQQELRTRLGEVIGEDTIIIGHSVENDLGTLGVYHGRIIDTARIFISYNSRTVSLADLARRLLKKDIQRGQHDSVEDALTCLQLLSMRVSQVSSLKFSERRRFKDTENLCTLVGLAERTDKLKKLFIIVTDTKDYYKYTTSSHDLNVVLYSYKNRFYVAI